MPSRRGLDCDHMCSLGSVKELISMADSPTANWSTGSTPLTWAKTAVGVLAQDRPQGSGDQRIATLVS